MIDTHCHLNIDPLQRGPEALIAAAGEVGVHGIVVPGVSLATSKVAVNLACQFASVYAAVGIHPHEAASEEAAEEGIKQLLDSNTQIVAVGEIGLDYVQGGGDEAQSIVFRSMLELARQYAKPVIIHTRAAHADTLKILSNYPDLSVLIHSFSGSLHEAKDFLEAGYFLGLNGIITFKKNEALRQVVQELPLERIVLETDAPYLTPEGFRGKDNAPAHVADVAKYLANIKGLTVDTIDEQTTVNATRFFHLPV